MFAAAFAVTGLLLMALKAADTAKAPTLTDADRANFLLVQRDWINLQKNYEDAFKKEPVFVAFETQMKHMQEVCGTSQFNQKTVQCEVPPPPPTKPTVTDKK
jgi:hypothetical protein